MIEREAGAVVVHANVGAPQVLLVTASGNPHHWLFPKGHIEANETAPEAALREAREEAGVEGKVIAAVGSTSYEFNDRRIEVEYFLVRASLAATTKEGRTLAWLDFATAKGRLSFAETRNVLDRVEALLAATPSLLQADFSPGTSERK